MRKRLLLILACLAVAFTASACAAVDDKSPATVVINVNTPVAASDVTVTSSAGTVSADGYTFTVSLPDRRGDVITVSSYGFETVTLRVGAKDFDKSGSKTFDVDLSVKSGALLQLTVSGGVAATVTAGDYSAVKQGGKYTFSVPDRDSLDVEVTVAAEGYETFTRHIRADDLLSGYWFGEVRLVKSGYKLIKTKGYSEVAFTRDFKAVNGSYDSNYDYVCFEMKSDDILMLEKQDGTGFTLVRGADIGTYGSVYECQDFYNGEQYCLMVSNDGLEYNMVYADYGDGQLIDTSCHIEDGGYAIWLRGVCTLYLFQNVEYLDNVYYYDIRAYEIGSDVLFNSNEKVFLDDGSSDGEGRLIPAAAVYEDVPQIDKYVDSTGAEITENFASYMPIGNTRNELVTDGDDVRLETKTMYALKETYRFRFDRLMYNYPTDQSVFYEVSCYNVYDSLYIEVDEDAGTSEVVIHGCADSADAISFSIKTFDADYFMLNKENFCFDKSEMQYSDGAYRVENVSLHDYVSLYVDKDYFYSAVPQIIAEQYPAFTGDMNLYSISPSADGMQDAGNGNFYIPSAAAVTVTAVYEAYGETITRFTLTSEPVTAEELVRQLEMWEKYQSVTGIVWNISTSELR